MQTMKSIKVNNLQNWQKLDENICQSFAINSEYRKFIEERV